MARGPAHKVGVPAKAVDVRSFIDGNRNRFLQELENVRSLVSHLRDTNPLLRCIYKTYSRGDSQGGDELKSSRKVRLKFDEHNLERGNKTASLFDVPDIIGLTVVVSYPSDIDIVAAALDGAIDNNRLTTALPKATVAVAPGETGIATKYGRPMRSKGYLACHYNVRMPGTGPRPMCELQIKGLLHDAWGAKTHDLTYKPTGQTDRALRESFDLLGDMLANLDKQSDTLRQSIERTSAIRERKRRDVRISTLAGPVEATIQDLSNAVLKRRFTRLFLTVATFSSSTPVADANKVFSTLLTLFDNSPRAASLMLCFLAAMIDRREFFQHAQDAIDAWEDKESDELVKLRVRCLGALAAFSAGDASEAIDIAEEIAPVVDNAVRAAGGSPANRRALRLAISLYSSLAYYHADRIGSHEGEKRDSCKKALEFLQMCMPFYKELGLPPNGLLGGKVEVEVALVDGELGSSAFEAFDNEAFVRIQTAGSEPELKKVRDLLHHVHAKSPLAGSPRTAPLLEYHDYCARMRLAELEASAVV